MVPICIKTSDSPMFTGGNAPGAAVVEWGAQRWIAFHRGRQQESSCSRWPALHLNGSKIECGVTWGCGVVEMVQAPGSDTRGGSHCPWPGDGDLAGSTTD